MSLKNATQTFFDRITIRWAGRPDFLQTAVSWPAAQARNWFAAEHSNSVGINATVVMPRADFLLLNSLPCSLFTDYVLFHGKVIHSALRETAEVGNFPVHLLRENSGGPWSVHLQNVRFQNVWNVRFTKRQVCKTSGLPNVRSSKRPVAKKHPYIFCTCGCWKSAGSVAAMFAGKVMAVFYYLF